MPEGALRRHLRIRTTAGAIARMTIVAAAVASCHGSEDGAAGALPDGGASGDDASTGADTGGGGGDAGGGPTARVRFLDLFHPTFLRVDYCLGSPGHWMGPFFAGQYDLPGYGSGGYQGVTAYAQVPPGTYTLRLVSLTSESCDATIDGIADLPLPRALVGDGVFTIAVAGAFDGDASDPAHVQMFDDAAEPANGPGKLRIVNLAALTGPIDVSRINVNVPSTDPHTPVPLFTSIAVGAVGHATADQGAGASDAKGYVSLPVGDPYFYYNLPIFPSGGDVNNPPLRLHETDGFLVSGSWTFFMVNNQGDGALRFTACNDNGSLTAVTCEIK